MALFVFCEVMLFASFISAFMIVEKGAAPGMWPPPGQPRLPVERTALNSAALLASGVVLWIAGRAFRAGRLEAARRQLGGALLLGAFFLVFQGAEWVALIGQGLTLTSSQLGSFFYLIVGAHALHAVAAMGMLIASWRALGDGRLAASPFGAARVLWYFVVLMWPLIYATVYL
jgi:heme/copper-type cytochrome/quinol oxidase subunit 3